MAISKTATVAAVGVVLLGAVIGGAVALLPGESSALSAGQAHAWSVICDEALPMLQAEQDAGRRVAYATRRLTLAEEELAAARDELTAATTALAQTKGSASQAVADWHKIEATALPADLAAAQAALVRQLVKERKP